MRSDSGELRRGALACSSVSQRVAAASSGPQRGSRLACVTAGRSAARWCMQFSLQARVSGAGAAGGSRVGTRQPPHLSPRRPCPCAWRFSGPPSAHASSPSPRSLPPWHSSSCFMCVRRAACGGRGRKRRGWLRAPGTHTPCLACPPFLLCSCPTAPARDVRPLPPCHAHPRTLPSHAAGEICRAGAGHPGLPLQPGACSSNPPSLPLPPKGPMCGFNGPAQCYAVPTLC